MSSREHAAQRNLLACLAHERERTFRLLPAPQELLFLSREQLIQESGVASQQARDLRELQTDALQRDHLIDLEHVVGAVNAPARFRPPRLQKAVPFVNAQRAHAHAQPAGGLGSGEGGVGCNHARLSKRHHEAGPKVRLKGKMRREFRRNTASRNQAVCLLPTRLLAID